MSQQRVIIILALGGILLAQGIAAAFFFALSDEQPETVRPAQSPRQDVPTSGGDIVAGPQILRRFSEARARLAGEGIPFLEINFSENKVKKYEEGEVVLEAPILAAGDPQGWGGTPAGLYRVEGKSERAYSGISQVYMPHAVPFYGKYLFHGEPYYPGGAKLDSDVSGGCIRLQDQMAEAVYQSVEKYLPILVIDKENDDYAYEQRAAAAAPLVSAESYLVADLDSGFVFAQKNSVEEKSIASLTKLMTALVVAEQVDLRKSVRVTEDMLQAYGTTEGLQAGERYRVVELFYPLLVASSNDAAEALAGFLGRERTIAEMNKKAAAIFMPDTRFKDPSGFDPSNTSTAQDLFYLARYVRNNRPPLLAITKGEQVRSYGEVRFRDHAMWNKNVFIADTSFEGGKTGYITASKHTGIFLFRFRTPADTVRTIAFILLGSQADKLDTQRLYAWLQRTYGFTPDYKDSEAAEVAGRL